MPTRTPNGGATLIGSPPELSFAVERVEADRFAVVPTLLFSVAVERLGGGPVRSIALNTQIRIAATRRSYDGDQQERLFDVFGWPGDWARTVRSFPWTTATVQVPGFTDATVVDLPIVCTYDLEVTTAQYLHALGDGEVPLELLFSGTLFYAEPEGQLRIAHIPWEKEAEYRLPVAVWRGMMDRYFPNSGWLRLGTDSLNRLHAFKRRGGHVTWDGAIEALLEGAGEER